MVQLYDGESLTVPASDVRLLPENLPSGTRVLAMHPRYGCVRRGNFFNIFYLNQ